MPSCIGGFTPRHCPAKTHGQSCDITPVTRRDVFDLLRAEKSPWWGRLDETEFLGQLYDLDALPSTDPRHATAGEDIVRHRVANFDWDDDWVFSDQRFQLADGPDQVLLDFLALMAHPLVRPDTEQAARLVASLNVLLAPDGWELRTARFISGRPVYSASRATSGAGRMIRLEIGDDDAGKLDIVLGQAHHLLGENGDAMAQGLIAGATLTLRRDGGYFHPVPGDNWTSATYEAVLTVAPEAAPEFTPDVESRVWSALSAVLAHHGRDDVLTLVIARAIAPLPAVSADWRLRLWSPPSGPPTRLGASAREMGTRPRTASPSAARPSSPSTTSWWNSNGTFPSGTRSPCFRCPVPGSAILGCAPRTSW